MEIGIRAAKEIMNRQDSEKSIKEVLREIGVSRSVLTAWYNGTADPSAYRFEAMAKAGYDIYYIITGERKYER